MDNLHRAVRLAGLPKAVVDEFTWFAGFDAGYNDYRHNKTGIHVRFNGNEAPWPCERDLAIARGLSKDGSAMEIHTVTGKLAGTYETQLAGCTRGNKRLVHALIVSDDGYGNEFRVERAGVVKTFSGLAAASREYDRA